MSWGSGGHILGSAGRAVVDRGGQGGRGVRGLTRGISAWTRAIGSRTAWAVRAVQRRPPAGEVGAGEVGGQYLSVEEVTRRLRRCTRAGLTGGFRCIGDAAVTAGVTGLQRVAAELGVAACAQRGVGWSMSRWCLRSSPGVAGVRWRASPPGVRCGVGGPKELYEQRLGVDRARGSDPLGAWLQAGGPVAYGTDAPVTPLAGWAMVADAVRHHRSSQRSVCGQR